MSKAKNPEWPIHPACEAWGEIPLDQHQMDALVESIRRDGVKEPIKIYGGQILDGRNRYHASRIARVTCPHVTLPASTDPVRYVCDANAARRQSSPGERARVVLRLVAFDPTVPPKSGRPIDPGKYTLREQALMAACSTGTLKRERNALRRLAHTPEHPDDFPEGSPERGAAERKLAQATQPDRREPEPPSAHARFLAEKAARDAETPAAEPGAPPPDLVDAMVDAPPPDLVDAMVDAEREASAAQRLPQGGEARARALFDEAVNEIKVERRARQRAERRMEEARELAGILAEGIDAGDLRRVYATLRPPCAGLLRAIRNDIDFEETTT